MRVAVIADTHLPRGARRLPDGCLALLGSSDLVLHAGDIATLAVLEELRALGPPVEAVFGNVDEPALRRLLPEKLVVDVGRARIGLVHDAGPAAGREARLARVFDGCDAVVYGHTHMPQAERVGGVWILNPGSPTERRRAPTRSMLTLRFEEARLEPHLVSF